MKKINLKYWYHITQLVLCAAVCMAKIYLSKIYPTVAPGILGYIALIALFVLGIYHYQQALDEAALETEKLDTQEGTLWIQKKH